MQSGLWTHAFSLRCAQAGGTKDRKEDVSRV
jgi:hypothetical protein